ncbi:MAG: hypothetical protein COX90_04085 [Candidatus Nealsonbacteria bacterium CG_4_10_14_0_2_um_filter_38_17]|uniref:Uncharacterized protein n=2 Tax=Candidatus Nealsoniibacteriota TaxID=1817911 RepID=A0A2M7UX72_9BACT|nr:MAG: hypothetical protein COX36_02155 [Candidatus Nealsonbacteria bacterium CG23_combo_of_CG06-09_8_20_14_all_38_19]PIZ88562.1 MAG: hypothetical protein COX90_04085 [Candidatus Nealsonbacteria bacterium CG_4_10_14_0_2_um_filter_38_17]
MLWAIFFFFDIVNLYSRAGPPDPRPVTKGGILWNPAFIRRRRRKLSGLDFLISLRASKT